MVIVVELWEEKKQYVCKEGRSTARAYVIGRGDCHMIWMEADFNPHLSIRVWTLVGRRAKRRPSELLHAESIPSSYHYFDKTYEISKNPLVCVYILYLIHT